MARRKKSDVTAKRCASTRTLLPQRTTQPTPTQMCSHCPPTGATTKNMWGPNGTMIAVFFVGSHWVIWLELCQEMSGIYLQTSLEPINHRIHDLQLVLVYHIHDEPWGHRFLKLETPTCAQLMGPQEMLPWIPGNTAVEMLEKGWGIILVLDGKMKLERDDDRLTLDRLVYE